MLPLEKLSEKERLANRTLDRHLTGKYHLSTVPPTHLPGTLPKKHPFGHLTAQKPDGHFTAKHPLSTVPPGQPPDTLPKNTPWAPYRPDT